jgi:hypothetical protein
MATSTASARTAAKNAVPPGDGTRGDRAQRDHQDDVECGRPAEKSLFAAPHDDEQCDIDNEGAGCHLAEAEILGP